METQTTQTTKEQGCVCDVSIAHSKRIHGVLSIVLVILAVFLFAETLKSFKEYRYVGGGVSPSNIINVTGEGEVFAVPDTAEFTFTVMEEAATAAEVQSMATAKANEVIKALVEQGKIEEKDIKTVAYNLNPKYEWKTATNCTYYGCPRNQVQTGFELNQSVRVKVRDLDRAGEMLELVTGKGVSSVTGLTFTIADEDGLKADARKQAIDDARAKAEKLANDLGVSLVRIVGFSENEGGYMPLYARFDATEEGVGIGGAAPAPVVPAGENKVVSNVNITYEIR